jgi:hypothetical protein
LEDTRLEISDRGIIFDHKALIIVLAVLSGWNDDQGRSQQ